MKNEARCDRCNGPISRWGGFLFDSSAAVGFTGTLQETGTMLLCEACTDQIVNEETWLQPITEQREISALDVLDNPQLLRDTRKAADRDSIVKRCKAHEFTPEQARAKAQELASVWWANQETGEREARAFWRSSLQQEEARRSAEDPVARILKIAAINIQRNREEKERSQEENRKEEEAGRRAEEERRKPTIEQRKSQRQCSMCGQPLGFLDKLLGRDRHGKCAQFHD